MAWLPDDFRHPELAPLPTGHHLRPIRGADTEIDYPAVMGSRERLWAIYGAVWGWPPASMTVEEDRADLERHAREIDAHESFNYALLDAAEAGLFGCVYIDPPAETDVAAGHDAVVSWWVVDDAVGTELERALDAFVPRWLATDWPFGAPRIGV